MKKEVLVEIATYHSFSTLIHKSHTLSGWVIALIVKSTHTSSCPGAINSQKHCFYSPFCLDKDLYEWVAGGFSSSLRWRLLVSIPGANPSLWLLHKEGQGCWEAELSPYSGVWLCYQMPGRGRTLFLFVLFSLVADLALTLSHLFSSVFYGLSSQGEISCAFITLGSSLLPLFEKQAWYLWLFLKAWLLTLQLTSLLLSRTWISTSFYPSKFQMIL